NFRKGAVKYPFSKLADGPHTLKVKAWDIHTNSSEEYTEFIVASDAKLALSHVYNYPNPFTTRTQFMFEHNRACDDLKVSIQIYTVSGKVVKSIQRDLSCDGYRVNDIEWDGRDDYGDPIGKGVYVYKLHVRDSQGNTANKYEKLVVLR
nr:T9SS type A sorting domain-containing protein [Chitinophagales bacterium]